MKHLSVLLLVLCLLFSPATLIYANAQQGSNSSDLGSNTNVSPDENQEIQRAIEYGFVPSDMQGEWDNAVTYGEFCSLLYKVMVSKEHNLQNPFPQLSDELSNTLIDRQEAMIACMIVGLDMGLVEAMDYDEEQKFTQGSPDESKGSLIYPDWNKSITISNDGNGNWENYIIAGTFYGMRQVSLTSGIPLFVLTDGDLRTSDLLTREEAVLAAVRLYESVPMKSPQVDKADTLPQTNIHNSAIAPDNNPEIQRAIEYGLVPAEMQSEWTSAITYDQFCMMLNDVVTMTDISLHAPWPQLDDSIRDELITRQEAMIACMIAGLAMGLNEANNFGEEQNFTHGSPDQTRGSLLYPDWNRTVTISNDGNGNWENYIIGGVFYGMRQVSRKSGTSLFTLIGGDLRTGDLLTREEAVLAAVRLFESIPRNYIMANKPVELSAAGLPEEQITADFDIQRAIKSGIIPENIQQSWNDQITYRQFCTILSKVISTMRPDLKSSWEELAKLALISDRKITRQEAMLALFYTADILGAGDKGNRFLVNTDHSLDNPWDEIFYYYPEFPRWTDLAYFGDVRQDYMTSAYYYCMNRFSMYSAMPVFECDTQIKSMRVADPCTVEEAIKAAQRLMDSIVVLTAMDQAPPNTVTAEAIEAGKKMPSVSPYNLPKWYGYAFALWDNPSHHNWRYYTENTIRQLDDVGFNFLRMVYHQSELFEEKDGQHYANLNTFQNLDNIITWCAKYNIHITVQLHQIPGIGTNGPFNQDRDIMENPEHYRQSMEIYDFMSKRYANIPSNLLSFTLLSEPPLDYFTFETHAKLVEDLAAVIRKNSPDRLIIAAALQGDDTYTDYWTQACPKIPNYLLDPSIVQADTFPGVLDTGLLNGWPYDEAIVVNNTTYSWAQPFTIKGSFKAGTEITAYITAVHNADPNAYLLCKADGKEVGTHPLTGFVEGADNCSYTYMDNDGNPVAYFGNNFQYNGLEVTFKLPKKASSITLAMKGVDWGVLLFSDIMVKNPTDTEQDFMVVDKRLVPGGIHYEKGNFTSTIIHCPYVMEEPASTVTIKKDGTYTCKQKYKRDVFDLNSARAYFDKWEAWSKETGGSYFEFEFCSISSLPKDIRVAYMRSIMELFKEYDISWTLSADRFGTGDVISYKGAENLAELFPGATTDFILPADGSYSVNSDYDYDCYYDDAVISVMQEYMQ